MPAHARTRRRTPARAVPPKTADVLDVRMTAALLTVSPDTVYALFARGELPGRKVGRKWLTTRAAVLRWIESTSTEDALVRALERGDKTAAATALNRGTGRIRAKA